METKMILLRNTAWARLCPQLWQCKCQQMPLASVLATAWASVFFQIYVD